MKQAKKEFYIGPRDVRSIAFDAADHDILHQIGIHLPPSHIRSMQAAVAMDAIQGDVTTPSVATPVQFLQNWLPGFVGVLTRRRGIDALVGITTSGAWEDAEVVQGVMEYMGNALPYGDIANVNYSDWNTNWNRFTNVRFEIGMQVHRQEMLTAARINVDSAAAKRNAAILQLEIIRNFVGFYGYNNGDNNTFGFLNAPGLPAYVSAPVNAVMDTTWATSTYLEIVAGIRQMIVGVRSSSGANVDPKTVPMTLALATSCVDYLGVTSQYGNSVQDWLTTTYPKIRVVDAPELDEANGGENVAYLYAESISDTDDGSTDDNKVFVQVVPAKFYMLGVQQETKGYKEDYSNATCGVFCKRPWAVYRMTGI